MVVVNCSKTTMKIVYVFDIHEALTKQINRYTADNIKKHKKKKKKKKKNNENKKNMING